MPVEVAGAGLIELGGPLFPAPFAQGLLQKAAGLKTLGADKTPRRQTRGTLRRNDDFNRAAHEASPSWIVSFTLPSANDLS